MRGTTVRGYGPTNQTTSGHPRESDTEKNSELSKTLQSVGVAFG